MSILKNNNVKTEIQSDKELILGKSFKFQNYFTLDSQEIKEFSFTTTSKIKINFLNLAYEGSSIDLELYNNSLFLNDGDLLSMINKNQESSIISSIIVKENQTITDNGDLIDIYYFKELSKDTLTYNLIKDNEIILPENSNFLIRINNYDVIEQKMLFKMSLIEI